MLPTSMPPTAIAMLATIIKRFTDSGNNILNELAALMGVVIVAGVIGFVIFWVSRKVFVVMLMLVLIALGYLLDVSEDPSILKDDLKSTISSSSPDAPPSGAADADQGQGG